LKKNILLVFVSIIISLAITEIIISVFKTKHPKNYAYNRFMLFEQGEVFKNINNKFFKYFPNKKINAKTYYKINENFIKEHDYIIETNNFGLVQKNDINKVTPSILFLGDSFTEGQGSYSWLNKFNGNYKDYQIINGGIMGTGPIQFELMDNHISNNDFNIQKTIVLYLGDDMRRDLFIHDKQRISCLSNYKKCIGGESFYGFPISSNDSKNFLNFLFKYRTKEIVKNDKITFKKIRRNIKKKIYNLNIVYYPSKIIKNEFYKSNNIKILQNFSSLKNLKKKYKDNIIFIQLNTKQEILTGKSYETIYAQKFISKISNNNYSCNFDNNLDYFYTYDGHPNHDGYNYLYKCIKKIMDKFIF